MSIAPEFAVGWRDLTCELTPGQIESLEDLEHDCQTGRLTGLGDAPLSDDEIDRLLLDLARKDVESSLRAMMFGGVQLPSGAVHSEDWEGGDSPYRVIFGAERGVAGHRATVRAAAIQFTDGRVDDGQLVEAPSLTVLYADDELSSGQARELAAVLLEAADELDRWGSE